MAACSNGRHGETRSAPAGPEVHYTRQRYERNAGLRLDYLLFSPELAEQLMDAGVDKAVRGDPLASDHAPAWIELDR